MTRNRAETSEGRTGKPDLSARGSAEAGGEFKSADTEALHMAAGAFTISVRRRLLLWVLRWSAGFALIAVIVYLRPGLAWLWWAGAGLAGLSLAVTLSMHVLVSRRVATAQQRIAEYERLAQEAEEAARSRDRN